MFTKYTHTSQNKIFSQISRDFLKTMPIPLNYRLRIITKIDKVI